MAKETSRVSTSSHGIGFFGLLAIVFITLKLTHVISWSWWWVLAPLWIGWGIMLGFVFLLLVVVAILAAFK